MIILHFFLHLRSYDNLSFREGIVLRNFDAWHVNSAHWELKLDFGHRRLDLFLWVFTSGGPRRPAEIAIIKFGIHSFEKKWDLLEENSEEWNNSAVKRPLVRVSTSASFLFWRLDEPQIMIENILFLQVFSLNVRQFYLYLLKQSVFRALKKRYWRSIFDSCRPKFLLLAF